MSKKYSLEIENAVRLGPEFQATARRLAEVWALRRTSVGAKSPRVLFSGSLC